MATWRKHFQTAPSQTNLKRYFDKMNSQPNGFGGASNKYSSWLPEVYTGSGDRIERYGTYEDMNADSEITVALDTIADFCTQVEEKSNMPFDLVFYDEASESEIDVLKSSLRTWLNLNKFDQRLWKIVRSVLMYGDQFFIRDPENYKWYWIEPSKLEKIVVNEGKGKKPEEYYINSPDLNIQSMTFTNVHNSDRSNYPSGMPNISSGSRMLTSQPANTSNSSSRFTDTGSFAVDAQHIVHISLGEGLDRHWPFGTSILESVYKVFKQKSLLEDSILIHRIHRAPERRVFYIDVGNMPINKAMQYVERIKNEIQQRRIPSKSGGGQNILDASYNPMSMTEDYFFAQGSEGRGSRVETLPGGENLGSIDDLRIFNNKLVRGLRVPSSYLPSGPEDGSASMNDGRATTALIQEFRFSNYCQRLQNMISPTFDKEFKLFLKKKGVSIDPNLFELKLNTPQNFAKYRQIELDSSQISVYSQVQELPYISKRFAMKRWLGMSEDEIVENETMWRQENPDITRKLGQVDLGGIDLRSVGVAPSGNDFSLDDLSSEDLGGEDLGSDLGGESPITGNEFETEAPTEEQE